MSGKHQRRLWMLPIPTNSVSRYDRMQIGVGRANSLSISVDHDTLIKTLLNYILEHDSLTKVLTNISVNHDTLISVSVTFNYIVNHDTLISVTGSQPGPPHPGGGPGGGPGLPPIAPPGGHHHREGGHRQPGRQQEDWRRSIKERRKKKADEVFVADNVNLFQSKNPNVYAKVTAMFELGLTVGNAQLLNEENIKNLTIVDVNLIDESDRLLEVMVLKIEEETND